jgi:hypothetical protein
MKILRFFQADLFLIETKLVQNFGGSLENEAIRKLGKYFWIKETVTSACRAD